MNDALNGRCEYRPRGRDPDENLGLLAEAIAKSAHLFNQGGRLVWIHARELRSVDTGILPTPSRRGRSIAASAQMSSWSTKQ